MLSSLSKFVIQLSSTVVVAMARYSASVVDRATIFCFLELQLIRLAPRKIIYPDVDVRSSKLLPNWHQQRNEDEVESVYEERDHD